MWDLDACDSRIYLRFEGIGPFDFVGAGQYTIDMQRTFSAAWHYFPSLEEIEEWDCPLMLLRRRQDVERRGRPNGRAPIAHSYTEIEFIRLWKSDSCDVCNRLQFLCIGDGCLFFDQLFLGKELLGHSLEEMLDIDVVGASGAVFGVQLWDVEYFGVGPAVDELMCNIDEPALLKGLFLG